jgi:hypothetical protein
LRALEVTTSVVSSWATTEVVTTDLFSSQQNKSIKKVMADLVECYSGSVYGERPTAFQWHGQRLEVEEVLERWRAPGGKGFLVRSSEGQLYELLYQEHNDAWMIQSI